MLPIPPELLAKLESFPLVGGYYFASESSNPIRGSYQSMIGQLEDELREYYQLKSGELTLPHHLDHLIWPTPDTYSLLHPPRDVLRHGLHFVHANAVCANLDGD